MKEKQGKIRAFVFIFISLSMPLSAQRLIVENFEGNNIAIYTPEYRLYQNDEIKTGFALTMGSIVETGSKTLIELRIEPQGTLIKLSENTTLKITGLAGYSASDMNELKLIQGAVRVIARVSDGEKPLVLSGHLTDTATRSADFGMVVRKQEEESVIVLYGEVEYTGPKKGFIRLFEGEMVNEMDRESRAKSVSAEYRKAMSGLAFKGAAVPVTDDSKKSSANSESSQNTGGALPRITPLPKDTASELSERGSEPEKSEKTAGSGETSNGGENKNGEKTEAEKIASLPLEKGKTESVSKTETTEEFPDAEEQPGYIPGQLTVSEVKPEGLVVPFDPGDTEAAFKEALAKYRLAEIYNVYKKSSKAGSRIIYSEFVDTVFLNEINGKNKTLVFAYTWYGASKNMAKGFFLDPTGRFFTPENKDIKPDISSPAGTTEGTDSQAGGQNGDAAVSNVTNTSPQGGSNDFFLGLEAGLGLTNSMFFDTSLNDYFEYIDSFFPNVIPKPSTLAKTRIYLFSALYIKPVPVFAVGIESGIDGMIMDITDPETKSNIKGTFFDVPVRGFLRFGTKGFFAEAFGGYYFHIYNDPPTTQTSSGFEGGLRLSFVGIFIECAYIHNEFYPYLKFAGGYALSFLPGQL